MMLKLHAELLKCRVREFMREPSAAFFVIAMPVLWIVILGYGLDSSEDRVYHVFLVDDSGSPVLDRITADLSQANVTVTRGPRAQGKQQYVSGRVQLIIDAKPSSPPQIFYYFDSASQESVVARSYIDNILQRAWGREDVIASRDYYLALPGQRYIDFLVPGLIALSLLTSSLFGTSMTIVVNRRENLLKRYLATPMPGSAYILSHILGRMVILIIEVSVILVTAYALFGFQVQGNFLAFLALCLLGGAAFTALAVLCGSRTSNAGAANGIANLIVFPMMLLGGIWFSTARFPEWLATFSSYLPLTALANALRSLALDGAPLLSQGWEIAILMALLFVSGVTAKRVFRWY